MLLLLFWQLYLRRIQMVKTHLLVYEFVVLLVKLCLRHLLLLLISIICSTLGQPFLHYESTFFTPLDRCIRRCLIQVSLRLRIRLLLRNSLSLSRRSDQTTLTRYTNRSESTLAIGLTVDIRSQVSSATRVFRITPSWTSRIELIRFLTILAATWSSIGRNLLVQRIKVYLLSLLNVVHTLSHLLTLDMLLTVSNLLILSMGRSFPCLSKNLFRLFLLSVHGI